MDLAGFLDEWDEDNLLKPCSSTSIQETLSAQMFSNGDASDPNKECVNFMENLIKNELKRVVEVSNEYANARK